MMGGRTMPEGGAPLDDRLTLAEVLEARGVPPRDCRSCSKFEADAAGRGFGWCVAHDMYVKLYHPAEAWHSQCQFNALRLVRPLRLPVVLPATSQ
jgi:hypothetical protein